MDEPTFADRVREVPKMLDSTNIKILSTMARVGPRNLLEVSQLTGIRLTTAHHRVTQLESKAKKITYLLPTASRLRMTRAMVPAATKACLAA